MARACSSALSNGAGGAAATTTAEPSRQSGREKNAAPPSRATRSTHASCDLGGDQRAAAVRHPRSHAVERRAEVGRRQEGERRRRGELRPVEQRRRVVAGLDEILDLGRGEDARVRLGVRLHVDHAGRVDRRELAPGHERRVAVATVGDARRDGVDDRASGRLLQQRRRHRRHAPPRIVEAEPDRRGPAAEIAADVGARSRRRRPSGSRCRRDGGASARDPRASPRGNGRPAAARRAAAEDKGRKAAADEVETAAGFAASL